LKRCTSLYNAFFMKKTTITFFLLLFVTAMVLTWLIHSRAGARTISLHGLKSEANYPPTSRVYLKLQARAIEAKAFAEKNKFTTSFCFLIDMSLPSRQKRFFIYDLQKDSIQNAGLVTHGRCNKEWLEGRKYGNTIGCGCTSLGRYKIGHAYKGRFGLAFKLYGLDKTNDNAFKRFVVLHAHDCVPETEVGTEICQSDGCPTVSPGLLKQLEIPIKRSEKPVLLWIFN
jgi:hypothetical protein